jgi:hypothetical protein
MYILPDARVVYTRELGDSHLVRVHLCIDLVQMYL